MQPVRGILLRPPLLRGWPIGKPVHTVPLTQMPLGARLASLVCCFVTDAMDLEKVKENILQERRPGSLTATRRLQRPSWAGPHATKVSAPDGEKEACVIGFRKLSVGRPGRAAILVGAQSPLSALPH